MAWMAGTAVIAVAVLLALRLLHDKRRSHRRSHRVVEHRSWGGIDEFRRTMEAIAPDTDALSTDED